MSELSLQELLDASPDGLLHIADDGRILLINRRAEEMFGYAHGDLVGRQVEDLLPVTLRASHVERRAEYGEAPALRTLGVETALTALTADGTELPVEISLRPLTRGMNRTVIATVRDGTDRRKTLEARTSEAVASEEVRIAQGLLDTVIGGLFRAGLTLHGTLEMSAPAAQERIHSAIDQIDAVIRSMRQVIFEVGARAGEPAMPRPRGVQERPPAPRATRRTGNHGA